MWDFILDFLFPKKCLGCGREGSWLCSDCFSKIEYFDQPYFRNLPPLSGVFALGPYRGILKESILAFKYDGVRELVEPLGNLLIQHLSPLPFERRSLLVPIPLHKRREIERGFNQAHLLALYFSKNLNLPLLPNVLIKIKNTKPQVELKEKERKENIKDAFFVKESEKHLIKNKTIFLVDDVMTTGATLKEGAKILKKNGAKRVWGLVLAKG